MRCEFNKLRAEERIAAELACTPTADIRNIK